MDPKPNAAVEGMMALVEQKAKELAEMKRVTNAMCRQLRLPEIYAEVEEEAGGGILRVRPDQFYGKSPIVAAREFLEARHEAARPEEILEAMVRGGFDFTAQNWSEKERLRLLAISLSKNSVIFHRLPNGTYGLLKWYPERERDREKDRERERREEQRPAGKKTPQKTQAKAQKGGIKPPASQNRKRGTPTSGGAPGLDGGAVLRAAAELSGQFTLDDVLPKLEERDRDRGKLRTELNRLAREEGSGIRLVKKGALKQPAIYESSSTADNAGGEYVA